MFFRFLALTLAASSPANAADETITAAPEAKPAPSVRAKCLCREPIEGAVLKLEGLVVDAELTVAPDGRSANDRQATIFEVFESDDAKYSGRTRIWHSANTDACGVVFDYGRKYKLAVRRNEAGELETDICVMGVVNAAGRAAQ